MFTRKTAIAAVLVLGTAASAAFAAAQDPDVIARKEAMGLIGSNVKKLTQMTKGEIDFDAAAAQASFALIAEKAATVPVLFEPQSNTDPESEAKDAIWENWDDFVAKANDLKLAADAGATVDSPQALGAAMGGLGGACKECHSVYKE
jgi:cytochrome c556